MKITSSGQVTVPRHIRKALGLFPGTDVEWKIRDGKAVLRKAPEQGRPSARALVKQMRGRATGQMSTDEIVTLTRGD
jgi:AbrB family looped-hinge helix DNA binding protein